MEEYTSWCDEEANTKEDAITSSKRTIGDLEATIEDAKASVMTLTSSIDELTTKISTSEKELADAKGIRDKEHEVFVASEKELADTVDSLDRAITVLKKNLSLMQTGKMANVLGAMASGLQKVVEASWINSHQKEVLQSLLQANAEASDSDEDLEVQPQGKSVAYESQSSGILDTLEDTLGFSSKVDFNAGVVAAGEAQIESTVAGSGGTTSDGLVGSAGAHHRSDVDAAREDIAWTLQTLSPQISALSQSTP